jgi:hypothetical protein
LVQQHELRWNAREKIIKQPKTIISFLKKIAVYLHYILNQIQFMKKTKTTKVTSNRPASYRKLTYIQKMSIINRKLRIGDVSTIASSTGYSSTHVSDVLSGKQFNNRIVNEAYDFTRGRISNPTKIQRLANS